jgi:hypothetical protein
MPYEKKTSVLKKSSINSSLVRDALLQNVGKAEQIGERRNSSFENDCFMDGGEHAFMDGSSLQYFLTFCNKFIHMRIERNLICTFRCVRCFAVLDGLL